MNIKSKIQHHPIRCRVAFLTPGVAFLGRLFIGSLTVILVIAYAAHGEQIQIHTLGGKTIDIYKDCHALVVGVEQYDHYPLQPEAVNNAHNVSWSLRKLGFSVKLLTDPTIDELRTSLDEFARQSGSEKNRGLLFYYCGNSQTSTSLDGKKIGRIIPKDAPLPTDDRTAFEQHTITTDELVTIANQIQSKHVLFLFDTMLSADAFQVEPAVLRVVNSASALPTRQFITAGTAQSPAADRTVFKKFLLRGLRGDADLIQDGAISASELGIYLSDRVSKATGEQLYPRFGTVTVAGDIRGDFIFVLTERMPKIARLSVYTEPPSAATQILNIKPPFTQGMELDPGKYKVRVSADGFETLEKWVALKVGEDRIEKIRLAEAKPVITNSLGMRMIRIAPGDFIMGSATSELGRSSDETQHRVKLTRSFFMQDTEVTVAQFKTFAQARGFTSDAENSDGCWITSNNRGWQKMAGTSWKKPGAIPTDDKFPAICITWNDAEAFARWLSQKENRTYRLPTEAEWEYAARAGTITPFSTGRCLSTKEANYGEIGRQYQKCTTVFHKKQGRPIQVGKLAPNPWKLYNIHGNVSEWCRDWYGPLRKGSATNPKGPNSGSERVMRGGHWKADASGSRSASRRRFPPNFASDAVGFRLVMVP